MAGTGRGREQLQGGARATDEGSQKSGKERSQVSWQSASRRSVWRPGLPLRWHLFLCGSSSHISASQRGSSLQWLRDCQGFAETCGFWEGQAVGTRQVSLTSVVLGLTEDHLIHPVSLFKGLLCVSCWGHEGEEEDTQLLALES